MKRIKLLFFIFLSSWLLSGCHQIFNHIPLDTLMVKKIEVSEANSLTEYNGVISVETIKELSINAVNTYLNQNLTLDQTSIVVQFYEAQTMENLITDLIRKPYSFAYSNQIIEELNEKLVGGIFLVSIQNDEGSYRTIVGGSSGQILEVSNQNKKAIAEYEDVMNKSEVIDMGEQYVSNVIGKDLSTVTVNCVEARFSPNYELYYRDIESNDILFVIEINPYSREVTRCYFGVWTLLN